jgi:hypothetical protein
MRIDDDFERLAIVSFALSISSIVISILAIVISISVMLR